MSLEVIRPDYRTRAQVILEEMRDRISTGSLAPGERLLLKPISEEFGCSEIPVREAMRALQAEGLITVIPHTGAFVSAPDIDELVELTEVRSILEPEATVAAAAPIHAAMLAERRAMRAGVRHLSDQNAAQEYGRLNRRFHTSILDRTPNQKMAALVKDIWGQADRGRLVYKKGPRFLDESMRQHTEIVDAIECRDQARLRAIVVAHSQYGLNAVRSRAAAAALDGGPPRQNQETR